MTQEEAKNLLEKYLAGQCTEKEIAQLTSWYQQFEHKELPVLVETQLDEHLDELWTKISERTAGIPIPERTVRLWPRIAVAASVFICLATASYLLLHQTNPIKTQQVADVAPFSKKAILKTGHGQRLVLDTLQKGLLAQYNNAHIHKSGDQIAYANETTEKTTTIVFDTLQVPAGGKPYHLQLADGSEVIVNVASALRFPENFRKGASELELLSGEAYFTIIHNAISPLRIIAKGQLIEDMGTEFDVNTYTEEPDSRTTLVSGKVNVNHKALRPGQQAIVAAGGTTLAKADVEQVTAWKNGYFRFNGEDIQTIMRELARWYNIEVSYIGPVSREGYFVKISRSRNISNVLSVLERTNSVHFKIEGRRVTVSTK